MMSVQSNLPEVMGKWGAELLTTGPELRAGVTAMVKTTGREMAVEVAGLSSWSHKIPSTVEYASDGESSSVSAGGDNGEAAAFEHGGVPGTFHHPTFGHRDRMVAQNGRPFFEPAFIHREIGFDRDMTTITDATFSRIGYH